MVAPAIIPSRESGVQVHLQPCSKFEVSLGYIDTLSQNKEGGHGGLLASLTVVTASVHCGLSGQWHVDASLMYSSLAFEYIRMIAWS